LKSFAASLRAFVVIVVAGGVIVGACLAAIIPGFQVIGAAHHYTGEIQSLGELSQRTTVYDAAGTQIGVLGTKDRQLATFEEIPKTVIDAVVAVEDQSFWKNAGIDIGGVFRAFVENVTSGEIKQGGSTISQQLVKNRVLSDRRDLDRKLREIVLAYRLNEQYTKREIITQYLNTVYFGQGSYGIKSAAERFFAKPLPELGVPEAALLAGLIANPEGDNPFVHPERARKRRAAALDAQLEQGYITEPEAEFSKALPLPTLPPPAELRPGNDFVEEVQARLLGDLRLGATQQERRDELLQGGLKIYTTLDPKMQQQAEDAVFGVVPEGSQFTAALVAMDPKTGAVKAMVKGSGYADKQFNLVTDGIGRQSGSTWKVITLATILANGYSPNDTVDGTAPCRVRGFDGQTTNAEGSGGTQTIRAATTGSVNCAFVRMSTSVGLDKVSEMAVRLGLKRIEDPNDLRPLTSEWPSILTLTLGTVEFTPLEMATVASSLASGGVRHDPIFVQKVVAPDGTVLLDDSNPPGEKVLEPEVAACAVNVLHGPLGPGGTANGKAPRGHDAFGKTGTTDDKTNAAFLGSTGQLAAFVWHGEPNANVPGAGFGGQIPATIWNRFMNAALAGQPDVRFPAPDQRCNAPGRYVNPEGGRADLGGLVPPPAPSTPPPTVVVTPRPDPVPAPAPTSPTLPDGGGGGGTGDT
jgi:membrane peptidoglycan carboxypeptidase